MPEISPELAARIESLKLSHAENPARFVMPLASAWREAGETAKAEELLRQNLKRHAGYLSAKILLGRCLADRGAYAEARKEFEYVLTVDPQNLIALRTLGDMAAAEGNAGEARRRYGELLSIDPMNAEGRRALAVLGSAERAPRVT
jgi:tetratricopeptide (TPR) repeat protein